jgi:hypothetical protein
VALTLYFRWTFGDSHSPWPSQGEIDVIEGIHYQGNNSMVVHTASAGCTCVLHHSPDLQTGEPYGNGFGCNKKAPNYYIKAEDQRRSSYGGPNFRGGVYAMQWKEEYIKIWFFPRGEEPVDSVTGRPAPHRWGLPAMHLDMKQCGLSERFREHKVVINITLCGAWAGRQNIWQVHGW